MTNNDNIISALDEAELFLRNRTMDGMSLELNEYDIGILQDISKVCVRAYDEITHQKTEIERLEQNLSNMVATMAKCECCTIAKAEAIKECLAQLDAEIESCKKYIREYDDREVQKAYCKGLESAYYVIKEMVDDV